MVLADSTGILPRTQASPHALTCSTGENHGDQCNFPEARVEAEHERAHRGGTARISQVSRTAAPWCGHHRQGCWNASVRAAVCHTESRDEEVCAEIAQSRGFGRARVDDLSQENLGSGKRSQP